MSRPRRDAAFIAHTQLVSSRADHLFSSLDTDPSTITLDDFSVHFGRISIHGNAQLTFTSTEVGLKTRMAYNYFRNFIHKWARQRISASSLFPVEISEKVLSFCRIGTLNYYVLPNPKMNLSLDYDIDTPTLIRRPAGLPLSVGETSIYIDTRSDLEVLGPDDDVEGKDLLQYALIRHRTAIADIGNLTRTIKNYKKGYPPNDDNHVSKLKMRTVLEDNSMYSQVNHNYVLQLEREDDGKTSENEDSDEDEEEEEKKVAFRVRDALLTVGALRNRTILKTVTDEYEVTNVDHRGEVQSSM